MTASTSALQRRVVHAKCVSMCMSIHMSIHKKSSRPHVGYLGAELTRSHLLLPIEPHGLSGLGIRFKRASSGKLQIFNNGHSVQVQGGGLAGDVTWLDGKRYKLQQFNFHRLSETTGARIYS